jgi:GDPmannose 4,6-dehydratase
VREFVRLAADLLGIELTWTGSGVEEKAVDQAGKVVVAVDRRYFRPAEVQTLLGDATKARQKLGWKPRTNFRELVREMVQSDLEAAEQDKLIQESGYRIKNHHA